MICITSICTDPFYLISAGDPIPSVDGVVLNHFDRLAFGRFHLFRYEAGGISGKKNSKNNTQKNGFPTNDGSLRHSVSWEDTAQKMGTEKDDVGNDGNGLISVTNGNEKRIFEIAPGWDFAQQELMTKNDAHSQIFTRNSISGNSTFTNLNKNNSSPISPSTTMGKYGPNLSSFSPKINNGVTREFLTRNSAKLNSSIFNSINQNSLTKERNSEEKKKIYLTKSSSEIQQNNKCESLLSAEKEVEEGRGRGVGKSDDDEKEKDDDANDSKTVDDSDTKMHREDLKLSLMSMENRRKTKIGNDLPRTIISQNTNNSLSPREHIRNTERIHNPLKTSFSNSQSSASIDTASFSTSSAKSSSSSRVMLSRKKQTEDQNPLNMHNENGEIVENISEEVSSSSNTETENSMSKTDKLFTDTETKKTVKNVIENSLNDFSTLRGEGGDRKEWSTEERTDNEKIRTDINGSGDRDSKYITNGRNEIILINENKNKNSTKNEISEYDDGNNLQKKYGRRIILSSARHLNQNIDHDFDLKSQFQRNGVELSAQNVQQNGKRVNEILNSKSNDNYSIENTEINNTNNINKADDNDNENDNENSGKFDSSISSPPATFEKEALALQLELTQMQKALQERMFRYQVLTSFNPDKKIEKT